MDSFKKPHLSSTQLDLYCKCGEAYRRRYVELDKRPPVMAMLKGTGFHLSAKANFSQKITSEKDLPMSEMVEIGVENFKLELEKGVELQSDESKRGLEIVKGEVIDSLAKIIEVHHETQAPVYQPEFVEQDFRIELPGARDLVGIIDLADTSNRVVDLKTAGKKKPQSEVDNSVQLTVYAAGYMSLKGILPSEVRLETIVSTKRTVKRDLTTSTRTIPDLAALSERIATVSHGIDAGIFAPATPGAWWCSSKWCGYFNTCKYVNSERLLTLDESDE